MTINPRSKVAAAVLLALSAAPALAADEEAKPAPPPGLPRGRGLDIQPGRDVRRVRLRQLAVSKSAARSVGRSR